MLFKKTKRWDLYRIAMVPRALTALSGLAPWSMAVDRTSAARRKIQPLNRGQGGLPLMLPPPLGERGVTLAISMPSQKTRKGFPMKIELFGYDTRFF